MSRSRKPRLIYDPNAPEHKRALEPMQRRFSWQLIAGGATAIAVSAALGITVHAGFLAFGVLGGLAFALGVSGLAERKEIALPAFVIGLGAPFVLTFGGHSVLMDEIGRVERCVVKETEEYRSAKYPSVDYVPACPSGEVELSRDWSDRLATDETDVQVGPPLRPVFAENAGWNLPLVTGVPIAMIALVPIARAVRKQP